MESEDGSRPETLPIHVLPRCWPIELLQPEVNSTMFRSSYFPTMPDCWTNSHYTNPDSTTENSDPPLAPLWTCIIITVCTIAAFSSSLLSFRYISHVSGSTYSIYNEPLQMQASFNQCPLVNTDACKSCSWASADTDADADCYCNHQQDEEISGVKIRFAACLEISRQWLIIHFWVISNVSAWMFQ